MQVKIQKQNTKIEVKIQKYKCKIERQYTNFKTKNSKSTFLWRKSQWTTTQ